MKEEICKNCGGKLIEKKTKRSAAQLKKPYYYSAYYLCPNCHKLYHDDKFKIINKLTPSLFAGSIKSHPTPLLEDGVKDYDIQIWTDGACVYNGTPRARAAWAFVAGKKEAAGRVEGKQTNNVAEGLAILRGLEWAAERKYRRIQLHTDSQISLFNLAKPASKVKINREIFEEIEKVIAEHGLEVDYVKVLGHSGDPNNERADVLANSLAAKG